MAWARAFAGTRFSRDQHREAGGGGSTGLLFQPDDGLTHSHEAVKGITGGAQVEEFLLIIFHFRFQDGELAGQFSDIPHVFEHYLSEHRNHLAVLPDGDPLDHHVLTHDLLNLVDLALAGLGDDVHPAVFDDLGNMFPDLGLMVDA